MKVTVLIHGEVPDTADGRKVVAAIEQHATQLARTANEHLGAGLEVHAERPVEMRSPR